MTTKTDDIKLPPPPEPDSTMTIIVAGHQVEIDTFRASTMDDHARAAVEADRRSNDTMLAHEWIRPALGLPDEAPYRFDFYARKIGELMADRQDHIADVRKMVPSDEEVIALWQTISTERGIQTTICDAERLRALNRVMAYRYGSSQPALERAVREVLDTELADLACTGSDAPAEHALGMLQDALNGQPAASAEPDETQALRDMLDDARSDLEMLRNALGVPVEPHQNLLERMLDAAKVAAGCAV